MKRTSIYLMSKAKFSQLEKSILSTICYYDIFDYPLTSEEIWRYLYTGERKEGLETDLNNVLEALEISERLKQIIDSDENYYFLKGRREIVEIRKERFDENKKKWKIAKTGASFIRTAPFIKYVAVVNSLAYNNAKKESDIDFFIVVEAGHIFTCRLFVTWVIFMLGQRRSKTRVKNRICLSFYITENALELQPLALTPRDPHFAFWAAQFVPLFDQNNIHKKIQNANPWIEDYLPNAFLTEREPIIRPNTLTSFVRRIFETLFQNPLIGPRWEGFIRGSQLKKMDMNKESAAKHENTNVVINDYILKFHEEDRREEYRDKFYDKLKKFSID